MVEIQMKIKNYRGFELQQSRPSSRWIVRIFKSNRYKQTSYTIHDAKALIDFCLTHEIW